MDKKEIMKSLNYNIEMSDQYEFTYQYSKYLKKKIEEFLDELNYNKNINIKEKIENRIDIDYVIERLEDILIMQL